MNMRVSLKVVTSALVVWCTVLTTSVVLAEGDQVTVPKTFGSSSIKDFKVVDSETVIFDVAGMGKVVAQVFPGCFGLKSSTTLAIRDRAFDLSRGSTLILADGERCSVTSVTSMPYPAAVVTEEAE